MHNNRRTRQRNSSNNQLDMLREIIHDYSEVIYYYNSNMRRMLDMIQPVSETQNNRNRNYMNQWHDNRPNVHDAHSHRYLNPNASPYIYRNDTNTNMNTNMNTNLNNLFNFQAIRDRFQDVIVRPTNFQIQNAVDDLCYDPSGQYQNTYPTLTHMDNPICPITMEPISPGTIVSRIRHCGHIFSHESLRNWFSMNTRCPCCRYDIRETPIQLNLNNINNTDISNTLFSYTQSTSTEPTEPTEPIQTTESVSTNTSQSPTEIEQMNIIDRELNNIFDNEQTNQTNISSSRINNSWRNISNVMRTFIQEEIRNNPVASELLYTFDIPLFDFSGNFYG
jgi:hypothetical protein